MKYAIQATSVTLGGYQPQPSHLALAVLRVHVPLERLGDLIRPLVLDVGRGRHPPPFGARASSPAGCTRTQKPGRTSPPPSKAASPHVPLCSRRRTRRQCCSRLPRRGLYVGLLLIVSRYASRSCPLCIRRSIDDDPRPRWHAQVIAYVRPSLQM